MTHHRKTPATTHISRLARDYVIQMVNPYDLREACEESTDYGEGRDTRDPEYTVLLQRKYENCSEWFLTNLEAIGVQEPLVVLIHPRGLDGKRIWQFDDGHHRLAYALLNNVEVPVVFDEMDDGDDVLDNRTCWDVRRDDVVALHDTTAEEAAADLIAETETYLNNVADAPTDEFNVIPVQRGVHRKKANAGGKHRAA